MSFDKTFISIIDMIEKSSKSATNLATQLSSYGSSHSLNQPVNVIENDNIISKFANESLILKENIVKEISKLKIKLLKENYLKEQISKNLGSIIGFTVSVTASYFFMKWMYSKLDPTNEQRTKSQKKGKEMKSLLGIDTKLDEYELCLAENLIDTSNLKTCDWSNIGGLQSTIEEIRRQVLMPLKQRKFISALIKPPKGLLLYGPPGCGKTMIAKAVANETDARFIYLQPTAIMDKWYGVSEKKVQALFSLANKISPTIIFIDEIDAFLCHRSQAGSETTQTIKTQFMTFWDGLTTENDNKVLIVGATNRIDQIDPAILRRMAAQFYVGLPNEEARLNILNIILKDQPLCKDVDLPKLARQTLNFSGSDLQELCRKTAIIRLRKTMQAMNNKVHRANEVNVLTKFSSSDFAEALAKMN